MFNLTFHRSPKNLRASKKGEEDDGVCGCQCRMGAAGSPGLPGVPGQPGTHGMQGREGEKGQKGQAGDTGLTGNYTIILKIATHMYSN